MTYYNLFLSVLMKVSLCILTFVLVSLMAQTSNAALLGTAVDLGLTTTTQIAAEFARPIPTVADVEIESAASLQKRVFIPQTVQSISDSIAKEAYVAESKLKIDTYTMATTLFNSQKYFGDVCNRCKSIEYFAFRMGNGYLTAGLTSLSFQVSGSPLNSQLFIG